MKIALTLLTATAFACLVGVPASVAAEPAPAAALTPSAPAVKIAEGIYVIEGNYNSTVALSPVGVIVIDTKPKAQFDNVKAEIGKLSDKPIRFLINTHYHYDHVDSNAAFRALGADIVAYKTLAKHMMDPPPNPMTGEPMPKATPEALPTITYSGDHAMVRTGDMVADLYHPGSGHTDGDTIVHFAKQNVVVAGDLVGNTYPNIDVDVGGSIDGTIRGVNKILSFLDDGSVVVPGHGKVLTKADVLKYREMLKEARRRIAEAKNKGMTEEQVLAANLLADLDPAWLGKAPISKLFPRSVYRSLPAAPTK